MVHLQTYVAHHKVRTVGIGHRNERRCRAKKKSLFPATWPNSGGGVDRSVLFPKCPLSRFHNPAFFSFRFFPPEGKEVQNWAEK